MKITLLVNFRNRGSAVAPQSTQPALGRAPGWVCSLAFNLNLMFRAAKRQDMGWNGGSGKQRGPHLSKTIPPSALNLNRSSMKIQKPAP